jgi:hypothetical protein
MSLVTEYIKTVGLIKGIRVEKQKIMGGFVYIWIDDLTYREKMICKKKGLI